jgi:polyether ionophore transport system permease protein
MSAAAVTAGSILGRRARGLGSVFAKTLRDSRRAILIATIFLAAVILTGGAAMATAFGTAATRHEAADLAAAMPPILQGLLGPAVGLTTLGGFIEWRFYAVIALFLPIWSILALSSTLAGEADLGSLDIVATTRLARRRIAIEKLLGHVVAVAVTMAVTAIVLVLTGRAFGTLPGDDIGIDAAVGFVLLTALLILVPGAIAFALSPLVGRGASAGIAAAAMIAAYFLNAFRGSIPAFDTVAPVSWYAWTRGHIPLAGVFDWPSLLAPVALILVLLVAGIVLFERRDIGITVRVPTPRLPHALLGLGGPLTRSFGERLPTALAWGLGIGLYVLILTSAVPALQDVFDKAPQLEQMMRLVYPDVDMTSFAGVLQLVFVDFGLIVMGVAAATIVAGWASDEGSGRLEVLLSAPISRVAWMLRSGLGALLAIVLIATFIASAAAIGAAALGNDAVTPFVGSYVMALYGCALAGIGLAVGGLFRPAYGAAIVLAVTILSFLDVILATALKLPDWVADLALGSHYGKPIVGDWDAVGVVASLVLALGGLAIGAWGLARRDVRV